MNYAVILAGGRGVRFQNSHVPKQFIDLTGVPMLVHSMMTAQTNRNIDALCVVVLHEYEEQVREWAEQYGINKLKYITAAGKERCDSVYNGLCAIPAYSRDTVMIMTSVCPFLSQTTIQKHYEMIEEFSGVITVVKATDAITLSIDGTHAGRTLQKKSLFIQQGPQTFRYGVLREAHELYLRNSRRKEVYEDSELVLDMGMDVGMVLGDRFCIKVTYPEDLAIARSLYSIFMESEGRK